MKTFSRFPILKKGHKPLSPKLKAPRLIQVAGLLWGGTNPTTSCLYSIADSRILLLLFKLFLIWSSVNNGIHSCFQLCEAISWPSFEISFIKSGKLNGGEPFSAENPVIVKHVLILYLDNLLKAYLTLIFSLSKLLKEKL